MRKIDPKTLDKNVFSAIGGQWMLITAGTAATSWPSPL